VVIAPVAPVAALFGNGSVKICALVLFTNILISLPCSAPAKSATAQICRSCHPVQLLCLTLENAVELPNLAALSTVALLVDFILLQLSSRPEHSFNLSGHFDRCTFSHVDLQCQPSSELTLSCACGVAQSRCADPLCWSLRCSSRSLLVLINRLLPTVDCASHLSDCIQELTDCLLLVILQHSHHFCMAQWTSLVDAQLKVQWLAVWCLLVICTFSGVLQTFFDGPRHSSLDTQWQRMFSHAVDLCCRNNRQINKIGTIQMLAFNNVTHFGMFAKHWTTFCSNRRLCCGKTVCQNEWPSDSALTCRKWINRTPSGVQLTLDTTPIPFATLGAHLLLQFPCPQTEGVLVVSKGMGWSWCLFLHFHGLVSHSVLLMLALGSLSVTEKMNTIFATSTKATNSSRRHRGQFCFGSHIF